MAAEEGGGSQQTTDRSSLLDVMKQHIGDTKTVTHQLTFASELGAELDLADAKNRFADEYSELFANLRERNHFIRVTGLFLLYPKFCLHCIECPTEVLSVLCKKLQEHESRGLLKRTKILYSCDVQSPSFMVYGHQILNFSSALTTEFKTNDPTEQVVADCLKNLAGLGEHARALAGGRITTPSQGQAQGALSGMQEEVPELVPAQGMLEYFIKHKQLESLAGYAGRLNQHLHVVLDCDIQWPIPERLYPYD